MFMLKTVLPLTCFCFPWAVPGLFGECASGRVGWRGGVVFPPLGAVEPGAPAGGLARLWRSVSACAQRTAFVQGVGEEAR